MMPEIETVATLNIEITVTVTRHKGGDGEWVYDWVASNGDTPDEWFESEEEAILDAQGRY